jgi:epoxyqueuosine reductase
VSAPAAAPALRDRVVAAALACGADAVRIAPATPLATTRAQFAAAVERGDLATWGYGAERAAAASDPATLLAGARSVVCVAVRYATPAPVRRRGRGRVSNYAWSADYHRRMRALLADLAERIAALGGRTAVACDTAPLAERAFAARAGLGWVGKHTNLIVPGAGSYVFLGEVLTTLALAPDAPLRKSCGSCARCVTACPTGALRGDHTIDATRCISDLTQRTDPIPPGLRPLIGDWVWGCDLCQEACPPTARAPRAGGAAFTAHDPEVQAPDLQALLALRSGAFRRRFAPTAMGWRGAAVLRRNAAVALGNGLDRADVPALAAALASDPHPLVRGHAAWALGRIASPAALAALRARSAEETEASVRSEIAAALEPLSQGAALG